MSMRLRNVWCAFIRRETIGFSMSVNKLAAISPTMRAVSPPKRSETRDQRCSVEGQGVSRTLPTLVLASSSR